jgi:hypothetical protein
MEEVLEYIQVQYSAMSESGGKMRPPETSFVR